MSAYVRYCKRCGKAFDIGINFYLCPKCRKGKKPEVLK